MLLGRDGKFGSDKWLIRREIRYGGIVENVPRCRVSPKDTRSSEVLKFGGMRGGDRMLHNGFARAYSTHLQHFAGLRTVCLVEVGILKGTGLAVWSDLFPEGRIVGLDIDPQHFHSNYPALVRRGAFQSRPPEVYVFDQLEAKPEDFGRVLNGRKIDILIDDGLHTPEAIAKTLRAARDFMSNSGVVFIEDVGVLDLSHIKDYAIVASYENIHVLRPD